MYNRGIGDGNLFYSDSNYLYFLKKYSDYVLPIAEIYSYCLMPNHFHFLIRIKSEQEVYDFFDGADALLQQGIKNKEIISYSDRNLIGLNLSKRFSNFFNGYAQAINKQMSRNGSLFSRPFKRKKVESIEYLKNLILYIRLNPVKHGFVEDLKRWKFSSYLPIITEVESPLNKQNVVDLFEDLNNFIQTHENYNLNSLIKLDLE
jgi:putative transposase